MENQTENQNSYLESLKKQVAGYAEKQSKGGRKTREDILAKYFVPRNTNEIFRILQPKKGKKHIQEAFFHVLSLNAPGEKKVHGKVIYCPAHNDPKVPKLGDDGKPILDQEGKQVLIPVACPACAKAKVILRTQDPSIKGVKKENMTDAQKKILEKNSKIFSDSNKWQAKKFYIVRGIDKGKQKDGVKFWRFKHNFRNQGTLDKLYPALGQYMDIYGKDFADTNEGSDLSITMADSEFNKRVYKAVSAIGCLPPSKLHEDPIIARQWLADDVDWRDVFLPKKAPNITSLEFLEMAVNGSDPYWDDSDQDDKKWRFPGRPDLEEKANTRNQNLDADDDNENIEQASDLSNNAVTINNVTEKNVGTFEDAGTDVGAELQKEVAQPTPILEPVNETAPVTTQEENSTSESEETPNDYDDLPF